MYMLIILRKRARLAFSFAVIASSQPIEVNMEEESYIERGRQFLQRRPLWQRAALVGLSVLIIAGLLIALSWIFPAFGDWFGSRRVRKLEAQITEQTKQIEAERQRAAELERQVAALEVERIKLEAAKSTAAQAVAAAEKDVEHAKAQVEAEIDAAGEPVDDDTRIQRIRERAAEYARQRAAAKKR